MEIKDNFNLFNLFLDKHVKVYINNKVFQVRMPSIKEFHLNEDLNITYHLWTSSMEKNKKILPIEVDSSLQFVKVIIFHLGMYKEYSLLADKMKTGLLFFIPNVNIDFKQKELIIEGITITEEIWDYILYLLKLSCGEKVEKPRTFASEEERKFYLAQKEMEEKIKKIKSQKPGDSEALLKTFLSIQYSFKLSFDYLAEQTMAQIQWLQKYAAGAVSYEVNAQAFAAGNMKKGKKLDFFIK